MEYLFNNKKEWSTDTCYNVDEPWKHYAKWEKPDKTTYGMVAFTCNVQNRQILKTESRIVVAWDNEEGRTESDN